MTAVLIKCSHVTVIFGEKNNSNYYCILLKVAVIIRNFMTNFQHFAVTFSTNFQFVQLSIFCSHISNYDCDYVESCSHVTADFKTCS